ncbi:MAG: heme-copper oxidase subunit III [Dietzia sp.]|uniref:aa3-type cytochrome oxidase subunit III n=1 Tax=unclassified Dietzia TaxID=2617939 RepID=UPI0015FA6535|nr:heme-copper oxidase subunit III [Dietzia sp.]MBB1050112.1 heme-copper oxidase subunit III [Dietzia sp. CW19]MDO8393157.1 heme-copper oxidase subunit III [Dietzia sp.]
MTSAVDNSGSAMAQRVHSLNRPNMVSVGTIIWLSQELMFFAGLFAMYFVSKANSGGDWPSYPTHLNVPFALTITAILVASSVTCQMGVFAAEQGDVFGLRRWYIISALMGTVFLIGQAYEYVILYLEGTTISSSVYGSVFFITTGFHGLHVAAGVLAFVVLVMRTTMSRFTPAQATAAIVVSYYWHFVDVVWIGLFVTIYFIQ